MGSKNRKDKTIWFYTKNLLKFILRRIGSIFLKIKDKIKIFIYDNIISIFIICMLLILLMVNVTIRNKRIAELEVQINNLQCKIQESEIILNDSLAQ